MIEKKDESEPKSLNKENINLNKNQINSRWNNANHENHKIRRES